MVQNITPPFETPIVNRGMADPNYVQSDVAYYSNRPHPHWGAIFAGIFVALGSLAILAAFGAAIGATAYDPYDYDNMRRWGIGSGVWAIVSAIISFVIGGYVAARCSGHLDRKNGLFHGLLVWAVAITLLALLVGTGMSRITAPGAAGLNLTPNAVTPLDGSRTDLANRTDAISSAELKRDAEKTAWGVLISLVLGVGAASLGGYLGTTGLSPVRRAVTPTTPVV